MADTDALTPRVFLARHGETEWAKIGRQTGITDIELTDHGIKQVSSTGRVLVGHGKLLDPARLVQIFVSPRKRAQQTFELLFGDDSTGKPSPSIVTVTEDIAEWDYGLYEGLKRPEILAGRKFRGLDQDQEWHVWRDGCEGGESPEEVTRRLDRLIAQIRDLQRNSMRGEAPADVLLVAHGLILSAFTKRWLKYKLDMPLPMTLAPGAIGVLSYKNNNVDEPAIHIGLALPPTQ